MSRRLAAMLAALALLLVAAAPEPGESRGRGWKDAADEDVVEDGDAPVEDGDPVELLPEPPVESLPDAAPAGPGGGSHRSTRTFPVPVSTDLIVEALGCSNTGGPTIRLLEDSRHEDALLELQFRSPSGQSRKVKDGSARLRVLLAGEGSFEQRKGGPTGLGGNPYIYLEQDDAAPVLLGRCNGNLAARHRVTRTVNVSITSSLRTRACAPTETAAEVHDVSASFAPANPAAETVTLWFARDRRVGSRRGVEVPVTFSLQAVSGVATGGRVLGVGGNPEVWVDTDAGFQYAGRCKDLLG